MMRLKTSKDSSRGFQVSSEISFLISVRKTLPTFNQTVDVTPKKNFVWELKSSLLNRPLRSESICASHSSWRQRRESIEYTRIDLLAPTRGEPHHTGA